VLGLFWVVPIETPIRVECLRDQVGGIKITAPPQSGQRQEQRHVALEVAAKGDQLEGVGGFHEHTLEFPGSLKSLSEKNNFDELLRKSFRQDWVVYA
jgi:hypothetical protein